MDVQPIECNKIEFVRAEGDIRTFNKDFARKLAPSIKAEGLHHPIVVRPNPDKPGFYLGVSGEHRHYAVFKVLKEQFIDCKVAAEMDATDAEMARLSENLWRNPLTKIQHVQALQKWWKYYEAKHPEKVAKGAAGGEAMKKKAADAKAAVESGAGVNPPADDEKSADDPKAGGFTSMVAAATGQSDSAVKRDARLARLFTPDQLEVFEQMKATKTDMTTIAKIKDEVKRGEIVVLIASGMEPEDAIKEVMKDEAPTRATGKSKATEEAKADSKKEVESNLSDDEWFEKYCGDKAKLLKNPAQYKSDALLFRKVSNLRHAFRGMAKGVIKAAKDSGVFGPFYYLCNRFISVSHPSDWLLCDNCTGTGTDKVKGGNCGKCFGGGHLLKTEVYL